MHSANSWRNSDWQKRRLVSYASSFVSFAVGVADLAKIRGIILFGSVARGEAEKESDIDIFIDGTLAEEEAGNIVNSFYKTEVFRSWELQGIDNDIRVITGNLDDWEDLKQSIILDGIMLYGKYSMIPSDAKHEVIFSWEDITPNANRVLFNKRMFGFLHYGKRYDGLLQKLRGEKIGKGAITIPSEKQKEIKYLLERHKVKWVMRSIIEFKA